MVVGTLGSIRKALLSLTTCIRVELVAWISKGICSKLLESRSISWLHSFHGFHHLDGSITFVWISFYVSLCKIKTKKLVRCTYLDLASNYTVVHFERRERNAGYVTLICWTLRSCYPYILPMFHPSFPWKLYSSSFDMLLLHFSSQRASRFIGRFLDHEISFLPVLLVHWYMVVVRVCFHKW